MVQLIWWIVNDSFFMKVIQFGYFFICLFSEVKEQKLLKKLKDNSQPVESGGNFSVKAGHFLKSPWDWWITFIYWCCVFSSVHASATLCHQDWKTANICIYQSLLHLTLSVAGKHVLEIGISCEAPWRALCPVWGSPVQEGLWQTVESHQDGHRLEHTRRRGLDLFSLERRVLWGIFLVSTPT